MNTIYLNSDISKTCKPRVLILNLADKIDLRKSEKSLCKNNKFKIPAPTWNSKFELPHGSYSISDIQDYFNYILRKHGKNIEIHQ